MFWRYSIRSRSPSERGFREEGLEKADFLRGVFSDNDSESVDSDMRGRSRGGEEMCMILEEGQGAMVWKSARRCGERGSRGTSMGRKRGGGSEGLRREELEESRTLATEEALILRRGEKDFLAERRKTGGGWSESEGKSEKVEVLDKSEVEGEERLESRCSSVMGVSIFSGEKEREREIPILRKESAVRRRWTVDCGSTFRHSSREPDIDVKTTGALGRSKNWLVTFFGLLA